MAFMRLYLRHFCQLNYHCATSQQDNHKSAIKLLRNGKQMRYEKFYQEYIVHKVNAYQLLEPDS